MEEPMNTWKISLLALSLIACGDKGIDDEPSAEPSDSEPSDLVTPNTNKQQADNRDL